MTVGPRSAILEAARSFLDLTLEGDLAPGARNLLETLREDLASARAEHRDDDALQLARRLAELSEAFPGPAADDLQARVDALEPEESGVRLAGSTTLDLTRPTDSEDAERPVHVLHACRGAARPTSFAVVAGQAIRVGNDPDAEMVFDDARSTCRIEGLEDGVLLRVEGGGPGVRLREETIREGRIAEGEVVRLGPDAWLRVAGQRSADPADSQWLETARQSIEGPESDYATGRCPGCRLPIGQLDIQRDLAFVNGNEAHCLRCILAGHGPFESIDDLIVLRRLGEGGMGEVYLAARRGDGTLCALKTLRGFGDRNAETVVRFCREARTGHLLDHPNIIRYLGTGFARGVHYLVMEYSGGQTVRHLLQRLERLPARQSIQIAYQVTKALEHALGRDIVHRDIKPENILIDRTKTVRLLDLGLAKSMSQAGRSGITRSGAVLGSMAYMAPEQIQDARSADHRADIYSLGVVLYEMVTGQRPIAGTTHARMVLDILAGRYPPMRDRVDGVPPALEGLVARALDRDPNARFQTPTEMGSALKTVAARGA